jgi:hypothetical protein
MSSQHKLNVSRTLDPMNSNFSMLLVVDHLLLVSLMIHLVLMVTVNQCCDQYVPGITIE